MYKNFRVSPTLWGPYIRCLQIHIFYTFVNIRSNLLALHVHVHILLLISKAMRYEVHVLL